MFIENVYQHVHPCISDWIYDSRMEICCFAIPSLPCIGDEEGLFFLRDCRRDISRHLKAYGLSKCSEDICNEADLLLCRGGELNIYFSLLSTIKHVELVTRM